MKTNLLNQASKKITIDMLENMTPGETITLNKRFDLYKYFDMEYFVLYDKKIDNETICVQYSNGAKGYPYIDLTDFYGYDDKEKFN